MPTPHESEALNRDEKLPTKKQVVAGFVVYRKTVDGIKFLMLYRRGNYWNFPKGHFKPGERTIDAALRELEEEVGQGLLAAVEIDAAIRLDEDEVGLGRGVGVFGGVLRRCRQKRGRASIIYGIVYMKLLAESVKIAIMKLL